MASQHPVLPDHVTIRPAGGGAWRVLVDDVDGEEDCSGAPLAFSEEERPVIASALAHHAGVPDEGSPTWFALVAPCLRGLRVADYQFAIPTWALEPSHTDSFKDLVLEFMPQSTRASFSEVRKAFDPGQLRCAYGIFPPGVVLDRLVGHSPATTVHHLRHADITPADFSRAGVTPAHAETIAGFITEITGARARRYLRQALEQPFHWPALAAALTDLEPQARADLLADLPLEFTNLRAAAERTWCAHHPDAELPNVPLPPPRHGRALVAPSRAADVNEWAVGNCLATHGYARRIAKGEVLLVGVARTDEPMPELLAELTAGKVTQLLAPHNQMPASADTVVTAYQLLADAGLLDEEAQRRILPATGVDALLELARQAITLDRITHPFRHSLLLWTLGWLPDPTDLCGPAIDRLRTAGPITAPHDPPTPERIADRLVNPTLSRRLTVFLYGEPTTAEQLTLPF